MRLAVDLQLHVAIVEVGMPDSSGYELARGLRAVCVHGVTLMALAAKARDLNHKTCEAASFDAFFVKPMGVMCCRN
jgi:CheY-like chemotaxis protein